MVVFLQNKRVKLSLFFSTWHSFHVFIKLSKIHVIYTMEAVLKILMSLEHNTMLISFPLLF